jgi:hypothetical protein
MQGGWGGGVVSSGWLKIYRNMHKTWGYNLYCALAMLLNRQNGNEVIRTKVQIMFKGMLKDLQCSANQQHSYSDK